MSPREQPQNRIKTIITEVADSEKIEMHSQTNDSGISYVETKEINHDQYKFIQEQVKDLQHYRGLRDKYARRVFIFMCIWSGFVFAILITKGLSARHFTLSDTVLTTLVGGTTVSVVGLVGFMMQGLFHSNGSNGSKQK